MSDEGCGLTPEQVAIVGRLWAMRDRWEPELDRITTARSRLQKSTAQSKQVVATRHRSAAAQASQSAARRQNSAAYRNSAGSGPLR
jgi:hypothetical protein